MSPSPPLLPQESHIYDVIIVGGGPAGSIAAMYLKKAGKQVLIVDKARFPRDKICGDAQGRKLAAIMKELGIYDGYVKLGGQPIFGLRLSSPNGSQIDLDLVDRQSGTPGYTLRRQTLDNFLFQSAKAAGVDVMEQTQVLDILLDGNGDITGLKAVREKKEPITLTASLYIGADGASGIFTQKLKHSNPPEHLIVATRGYYTGVTELADRIEIHMLNDLIPGYFWIFPMGDGTANVGLGMVVRDKAEKAKIDPTFADLRQLQEKLIKENALLAPRFKSASIQGKIDVWNLPVASVHRQPFGPRYLLLGDAASLINPLSGEGVGTAAISGKIAAAVATEALDKQDFSARFLSEYDRRLWADIGKEMKTDYKIQKIGKEKPHLIDKVVQKALANPKFRKKLESALPFVEGKKKISGWRFLLSLYF